MRDLWKVLIGILLGILIGLAWQSGGRRNAPSPPPSIRYNYVEGRLLDTWTGEMYRYSAGKGEWERIIPPPRKPMPSKK